MTLNKERNDLFGNSQRRSEAVFAAGDGDCSGASGEALFLHPETD
ncbi:hypothetical protein [Woeseia oceani]|nr:hypothetical protein [Woeseia oceani]